MRLAIFLAAMIGAACTAALPVRAADSRVSPSQAGCIAENAYYEARGEGATGMVAVGWVALNRARSAGTDVCSVIYERSGDRCQFSWVCNRHSAPGGEDWERALAVADALLAPGGLPDPTGGAAFFNVCGIRPGAAGMRLAVRIGAHCFWTGRGGPQGHPAGAFALVEAPERPHGWAVVAGTAGSRHRD